MSKIQAKETSMTNRKVASRRGTKKRSPTKATAKRPKAEAKRAQTKKELCLALLSRPEGASIADIQGATGWQAHSVRSFLAATVKRMPNVNLESAKSEAGPRRYHFRAPR
jgi:hypothetical protein